MLKLDSELRAQACETLRGKRPIAAVVALIYSVIAGGLSAIPVIGGLCSLFVGLPVAYGFTIATFGVCRDKGVDFGVLPEGFQDHGRIFVTILFQAAYTILWSLLLVISGIIKSCSYVMVSFILKDEPETRSDAAIEKSMAMMEGNKMKLFMLDLSFIGWAILCIFTLSIGLLSLQSYVATSYAVFYEDLKARQGGSVEANVEVNVEI